jgi:hypothetical protein
VRALVVAALLAAVPVGAWAADKAAAEGALAAAMQAENAAGKLGNRWLPAEAALKAAKAALAAGEWDKAAAEATRAEAMAHRAAEQAREQEGAWQNLVIR